MILLRGDFNGAWTTDDGGTLLCLSHTETVPSWQGKEIRPVEGTQATALEEDSDENGNRDNLVARGIVIRSPEWLQCRGSKWSLDLDDRGIYHESDFPEEKIDA